MIRNTVFLGLFLFSVLQCGAQAGSLDTTFGGSGKVTSAIGSDDDIGHAVAIQADGKLIVAGWSDNGVENDMSLIRYNTDGSPDSTFGVNGRVITVVGLYSSYGEAVEVQSDGKIIVAGSAYAGSYSDFALVRYKTDGTLDSTFGTNGKVIASMSSSSDGAYDIAIQSDGKIIAAGSRHNPSPSATHFALARFNSNGTLDPTFGVNGKVSTTFGIGSVVESVILQPDGKIVACGEVYSTANDADFGLARYNTDGSLDTTFGGAGLVATQVAGSYDEAHAVALQADGKLVTVGATGFGNNRRMTLIRQHSDGTVDSTFGVNGVTVTSFGNNLDVRGRDLFLQPDGKIVACGGVALSSSASSYALARYKTNGTLDSTFGTSGKVTTAMSSYSAFGFATLLQPDGKIVVAGDVYNGADDDFSIARYNGVQTNVNATRCGRIWYECASGNTRTFHVEIHTNGLPVSTDSIRVDYGDATGQAVCVTTFSRCDTLAGYCALFFDFTHTYSPGNYSVVVSCGKHLPGIENIPNSAQVDFCLLAEAVIDPNIGCNSSPVSDSLNLELAWLTGQPNVVSMPVWDPETDSVSWSLIAPACLQSGYAAPQAAGGGSFILSQPASTVAWNMPVSTGTYSVVFLFEEWVQLSPTTTVIAGVTTREVLIDLGNTSSVIEHEEGSLVMYPNPATQAITVVAEQTDCMTVCDLSGRIMLTQQVQPGVNTIDVASLAPGLYCVRIGLQAQTIAIAR